MDHFLKESETFFLILLKRIFLPVTAKPDTFLQMVHVEQVILPKRIDGLKHNDLFQLTKHR